MANARTFSFTIGSRWASPADFLSFHKPFLVCPYRKTHDPVDDASFNCWQFLQCVSILWMNEYAEIHHQPRKEEAAAAAAATAKPNNAGANGASPYQPKQASTATSPKGSTQKPAYSDAEFPTIASANATNDRRKQQQQRSPRRARAVSTLATTKDKTASPSRGSKQQHQHQHHSAPAQSHHPPQQQPQPAKAKPPAGATAPAANGRRTARSYSDPPLMELVVCSNTASAIAKASSGHPQHPRTPVPALF